MNHLVTATLSSKSQITLPREVRKLLGISHPGELVGFLIDSEIPAVKLTRVETVPMDEDFTDKEYEKLAKLCREKGRKKFRNIKALLRELKS